MGRIQNLEFLTNQMLALLVVSSLLLRLAGGHVGVREANGLADGSAVLVADQEEVLEHPGLNLFVDCAEAACNVLDAVLPLGVVEDLVEKLAWLLVVGVGVLVWVSSNHSVDVLAVDGILFAALNGTALGVWLVVDHAAIASSGDHHTVALIVRASEGLQVSGAVDGDVVVICTKSPSVGVWVVDESSLEHFAV